MAFYSDIKADLQDKPRREQYLILLQTAEWANFRMQILDRLGMFASNAGRRSKGK
jgi:hypothetical protein